MSPFGQNNALTCGKTGQGIVEVAGIEPASSGFSMGLLRAQPTVRCRIPPRHRPRRRIPANLSVPGHHIGDGGLVSPTRCRLDPTRKAGAGQTSLLFRQRARAVARHLFWFPALLRVSGDHGSLLPYRRPKSKPVTPVPTFELAPKEGQLYRATTRWDPGLTALELSDRPLGVPIGLAFGNGAALVVVVTTLG